MAAWITINPKEELLMEQVKRFNRQIFINNVTRIKAVVISILDFCNFIKSCLEWESPTRSICAFVFFMTITWYFEPYMIPVGLLLFFVKHYIMITYFECKTPEKADLVMSDYEDELDQDQDKEERKSLKERLQAIQVGVLD